MNKLIVTIHLILISSTLSAQVDSLETDFNTKKQQYEKAQQDLNKRYSEVLTTLHHQVSDSKLKPNPELLRKIEKELAILNVSAPGQWYLGDWQIIVLGKESFKMRITSEGWQPILKTGNLGPITPYTVAEGEVTTLLMKNRAVISKLTASGQKLRMKYFGDGQPEVWEGVKIK